MGYERLAWAGNVVLAGVGIWLSWWPASDQLGKWVTLGIAALVVVAVVAMYPRRRADGAPSRLITSFSGTIKGDNNRVQIARDNANQTMESGHVKRGGAHDDE